MMLGMAPKGALLSLARQYVSHRGCGHGVYLAAQVYLLNLSFFV